MKPKTAIAAVAVIGLVAASGLGALAASQGMRGVPPVVADTMGQIQFRHIKLGYAGKVGNWALAGYETAQIRRSFNDAARAGGEIDDQALSQWFDKETLPALRELDAAITEKNLGRFNTAFKDLTAACNKCHQSANLGFVKIQVPTASPYSNQSFPP